MQKACGEGLMPAAVDELRRLGVAVAGHPIAGITYRDARRSVSHRFGGEAGRGVQRVELSGLLTARAEQLGVLFRVGRAETLVQDARSITLGLTGSSTLRARWLLGSDGLHSTVRTLAGLDHPAIPSPAARRYGLRQHFHIAPWSDFVEVYWSPGFEVYVTPVGDRMIGVAMLGPRGLDFAEAVRSVPALAAVNDLQRFAADALQGAGSLRQRVTRHSEGRVLLVGDASGYIDALTGEGLRIGFAQAAAAVAAIVAEQGEADSRAAESAQTVGAAYERGWRRVSGPANRLTTALLLASRSPLRASIVPLAVRVPRLFGAAVDRLAR
ncbi:NAD(P)/FAD-dependent oxidoreductase [Subtercola sp. RTI3]|uniref:NAD(P)/FAD-dependent oxidoreductase n=1 Tax=Subtercola sp. RTI3 TaxID=3048639 RepID=UPI002B22FE49|nr:FAD-dependent monooxygenase [Subtercola sp. RTI3]